MWPNRRRKWPTIDLYQKGVSGAIKTAPAVRLDNLIEKANASGWSATGRPEWLSQNRDRFKTAVLVVFGPENPGLQRCIVTVILTDGSGGRFTLDMSESDLDTLEDLTERDVVIMAHRYLATFQPIDLDDSQAATWDQSVWKAWGNG